MTPEAQRIAIAEVRGWKKRDCSFHPNSWHRPDDTCTGICNYAGLPDCPNDLNAMHEAEKVLTYEQLELMHAHLADICSRDQNGKNHPHRKNTAHDFMWHATAAQRAEAFLRTLGLWKD